MMWSDSCLLLIQIIDEMTQSVGHFAGKLQLFSSPGMNKSETLSVQCLSRQLGNQFFQLRIFDRGEFGAAAVEGIGNQGKIHLGEVDADLVGTTGLKF